MTETLRDRKKRQTRQALVRATLRLAAEKGLDHVTVEEISTAADVSTRTFFNYFQGKDEAVASSDPEAGPRLRDRIRNQPAQHTPFEALKKALLDEVADELTEDRDLWLLRKQVIGQHPELLAKVFASGELAERHLVAAIAERSGLAETDTYPMMLTAATGAAFRVAMARWACVERPLGELLGEALDVLGAGLSEVPTQGGS
ncbi:TetR family transcriptional regulator [Lentzea sp. NBRC 105346]|uniref:TetR/AcrR family transcriptional regulator n=1 Tax=Lentzea sp. NBRC 105346 TaxID=3032205 RepID=UPI002555C0E6|nr:TetR family transcriptional regulator [Lentzea sp. NBRC 105346]